MTANATKDGKVAVSFWVEKELADKLDFLAEKGGITKSKLLSNMVEAMVHDMMILNNMGVIWFARSLINMREAIKNQATKYKNKIMMPEIMNMKDIK